MGLTPINRVPPRRRLTAAQRADQTVEEAKRLFVEGDISLERLSAIVENEYRPIFGLPPLPTVIDRDALQDGGPIRQLHVVGGGKALVNEVGETLAIIPDAPPTEPPPKPEDALRSVTPVRGWKG